MTQKLAPVPVHALPNIGKYIDLAKKSAETHNFKAFDFHRSHIYRPVISGFVAEFVEAAIQKGWSLERTRKECEGIFSAEQTAFVLNFAHAYWPIFEVEADLRESPGSMIGYLKRERPSQLGKKGYCSFFFSLLDAQGNPAGIVNGAVLDAGRILQRFKIEPNPEKLVVAFIGYVAVPEGHRNQNADTVLLSEVNAFVAGGSMEPDFWIAQVDKPSSFGDDAARKSRAAADLRLWTSKYHMGVVPGLRSMEIIHDYGSGESELPAPKEQPQLELIIRPSGGKPGLPYKTLENITRALYLYYEVPAGKVLDEYVRYTLEGVSAQDGAVRLAKPPARQ